MPIGSIWNINKMLNSIYGLTSDQVGHFLEIRSLKFFYVWKISMTRTAKRKCFFFGRSLQSIGQLFCKLYNTLLTGRTLVVIMPSFGGFNFKRDCIYSIQT